jgi:DNA-binding FrmR family transcriptional regulator
MFLIFIRYLYPHGGDRDKYMDSKTKKQTLKRLAIAEGHLRKVRSMVEDESYCPDIIHQSRAVQAALKGVDTLVLDGHLNTCVLSNIKGTPKEKSKLANELVDLFKKESNG